ncbi:MAG TPA: glyoxalase [Micromonosporaceae bacterium]|nr:glyoxalase [Micromonosporaceae bacterium]
MARLGRKPVRPGRVSTAVSLGTVGLFVISMAAGMRNWPFGAAGAAMLIIAVALLTTASMRGTDKAFVVGTVHVVKVSDPPLTTDFGRCEMQVLVDAPGHPGQTVVIRDPRVPVTKWPDVGETLPALVSLADVRRIKIQWDKVGTYGERYESTYREDEYGAEPVYPRQDVTDEFPPIVDSTPPPPPESGPLPRRKPSPAQTETHSVAVLEGELVAAEVPSPRSPVFDDGIELIDFSEMPEPPAATPPDAGPILTEDPVPPVMVTQPNARPASAGSIHGISLTVLVTDLVRSLRFYRDMLGFYEIDGGPTSVVLASGDTRVVLVTAEESAPVHRRMVHLNLEVGDVEAVYQELKVRGVRFTYAPRVVNRGERLELVAAAFKDPDGHGIAITQWKARAT